MLLILYSASSSGPSVVYWREVAAVLTTQLD